MRLLVTAVVCLGLVACAGTPRQPSPEEKAAAEAIKNAKVVPQRTKGPYRVVMVKGEKKYCRKELSTGSHVNFRTICLTEKEYLTMQEQAQQTVEDMRAGPHSNMPGDTRNWSPL